MKLHLPKGLRTAVLACFAAFAGIGTTISTATITGGVFAVSMASVAQAGVTVSAADDATTVTTADGTTTVTAGGTVNISADSGGSVTIAADGGGTVNVGSLSLTALKSTGNDITIEAAEGTTVVTSGLYNMDGDGGWSSESDSMLSNLTLTGDVTVKIVDGGFSLKSADITINAGATLYTGALMAWQSGEAGNFANISVNGGTLSLDNPDDKAGRYGLFSYGSADAGGLNVDVINGGKLLATSTIGYGNDIGVGSNHSGGKALDGDATLHLSVGNSSSAGLVVARSIRFSNSTTSTVVMGNADSLLILRDGFKQNEAGDSQVYLNAGTLAGYIGSAGVTDGWASAADMTVGNIVIHTSAFEEDTTGEWVAGTTGITMTLNAEVTGIAGTQLTVDGAGTLAIGGTLALTNSIVMGANASFTLLEGATIDVTNLTKGDDGSYTLLTAAADNTEGTNLSLGALTDVNVIGSGVEAGEGQQLLWSLNNGLLTYEFLEALSHSGGALAWGEGTAFTGGTFSQGAQVTFKAGTEASVVTLTQDITAEVAISSGATLQLQASDYTLTASELTNDGTLTAESAISAKHLTNAGSMALNAGFESTVELVNTGDLVLGGTASITGAFTNSGTVTVSGNATITTLDATNGVGTLAAANGGTLTINSINYGTDNSSKNKWWAVLSSWDAQAGDTGLVVIESAPGFDGNFAFTDNTNNITGRYYLSSTTGMTLGNYYGGFNVTTTHVHENAYLKLNAGINFSSYEILTVDGSFVVNGNVDMGHTSGGNYYGRVNIGSTGLVVADKLHFYGEGDASNRFSLTMDGGTLLLTGVDDYDQGITSTNSAAPDMNLNSGTIGVAVSLSDADGSKSGNWFSALAMTVGDVTFDTTKRVEDAATGAWVSSDEGGSIDLQGAITINGTVKVTGAGVLTLHSAVNNGVIDVDGTLGLAGALTMAADAQLNLLEGGKIDISQLTAVNNAYTLLTADDLTQSNLDLTGWTKDNLTGIEVGDYEWTFNSDGTVSFVSLNIVKYAGGDLEWKDGSTGFLEDKVFAQGASIAFEGNTTATLAESISVDALRVEDAVSLTLNDTVVDETAAGNTLAANSIKNSGTIESNVAVTTGTLTNNGTYTANAALEVKALLTNESALVANDTLSVAGTLTNNGTLELNADSSIAVYDAAGTGTIAVATDKTLTVGNTDTSLSGAAFKALLSAGSVSEGYQGTIAVLAKPGDWSLTTISDIEGDVNVGAAYDMSSLNLVLNNSSAINLEQNGSLVVNKLILKSGQSFNVNNGGSLLVKGSGNEALFLQGGSSLSLNEGGTITTKVLRESDDALGGTFAMNGGSLVISDFLKSKKSAVSLLGGSLVTSDADGWYMEVESGGSGTITLGAVTIDAANTAAITLKNAVSFAGTVDNDASLAIADGTALSVASDALSNLTSATVGGARTEGNGYAQMEFWLVDGSTVAEGAATPTLTLGSDVTLTVGEETCTVSSDGSSLTFRMDIEGGIYYVNENSVTYGGENSDMVTANVTGLVLNGGNLVMAESLNEATTSIELQQSATVTLNEGVTLSSAAISNAEGTQLSLAGRGTYVAGTVDAFAQLASLKDAADWAGVVDTYNGTGAGSLVLSGQDLNDLGNANSSVLLRGVTGYMAAGTVATNIELTNTASWAGLAISGLESDTAYAFSGKVSGTGNLNIESDNAGAVSLAFSGDVSGWTGKLAANRAAEVAFTGENQTINVAINGSANVTYAGTGTTTVAASGSYTGTTTISSGTVVLASGVTGFGSSAAIASGTTLHLQGNTLGCSVTNAGTLRVSADSSVSSLAGGALELGGKLSVADTLSAITSITVENTLSSLCGADSALVSAKTLTLGDSLAVNVSADLLDGAVEGVYTLFAATDAISTLATLNLNVEGSTLTDDGELMVGSLSYTLDYSEDGKSIILTGIYNGFTYDDEGNGSLVAGDGSAYGSPNVPGATDVIAFLGAGNAVEVDGSNGTIEVHAVRVESTGTYTFTGDDESDEVKTASLDILAGGVEVNGATMTVTGTTSVGSNSTASLNVAEGSTFSTGDMTVADGSDFSNAGTATVDGALVYAGVLNNSGDLTIGGGSDLGTVDNTGTMTVSGDGTQTTIDKMTAAGQMELSSGVTVTVAEFDAAGIDHLGLGTDSTFEVGSASAGSVWIDSLSGAAGSSVNAAGVDVILGSAATGANMTAESLDLVDAGGSSFTALTTDALTLNANGLKTSSTGALLTVDSIAAASGDTIELTLTGIGQTRSGGLLDTSVFTSDNAAGLGVLTEATDTVNQYTSYTLVNILGTGTTADIWNYSEEQKSALQQYFALAGSYAELVFADNGSVYLNVYADEPRVWNGGDFSDASSDDKWAGNENNNGGQVLDMSLINTYKALDTVDVVNISKDTTIDLTQDELSNAADKNKGLVLRDADGTGSVTLLGDGTGAEGESTDETDRVTFSNSKDTSIGGLTVDDVRVLVEATTGGAILRTGNTSLLNDAVVEVMKSGTLVMDNVELSGESAWIDNYGTVHAGDMTLSGEWSEVDNEGTMTTGEVMLSGDQAWLWNWDGSMTTGDVICSGDNVIVYNNGTMVVNGLAALTGDNAKLVNTDASLTVSDYVALNGEKASLRNTGTMTADALSLNGANSVAYNEGTLTVGDVWISGADAILVSAADASTTVASIDGSEGMGMLSGTINVNGSTGTTGNYSGKYGASAKLAEDYGYSTKVTLNLGSDAKQKLTIGGESGSEKLALTAEAGATTTLSYTTGNATVKSLNATGAHITLDNNGTHTLTATEASVVTGGTLNFSVSAEAIAKGETTQITSNVSFNGTAITVSQSDAPSDITFNLTDADARWTLFTLTDATANVTVVYDDSCTFLARYFRDIKVVGGVATAELVTDYYAGTFELGNEGNASTGMQMLDLAALQLAPQGSREEYKDMASVLDALDGYVAQRDSAAAGKLAAAVAGSGVSSLGMALSGDVERQLKAIRNRTTSMGVDPAVVNEDMPYFNAWINAEGDHRELDADGLLAGYELDSYGGTVGFDMDVNPNFTWGMAVTAMYGDFTADAADTVEGDVDTYYLSAFARATSGAWVHTFVATVGMSSSELSRTVSTGDGSYTAEGEADGISFGLLYEVARTIALNEDASACWQPVFNVAYRHVEVDGYEETGSDAALKVGDQSLDTVTFGLGGRLQAIVGESIYNRTSVFEARALVKFEAGDRESEMDTALLSAPAASGKVTSAEKGAVGVELGAGLTIPMGMDSGSIFVDGSVEFSGSYTGANGTVGYRVNF